jgi:hypothetical protein
MSERQIAAASGLNILSRIIQQPFQRASHMKNTSTVTLALIAVASSTGFAAAQDKNALIYKLSDLSFNQMAASYFCRKLIGDAAYNTAKDEAIRNGVAAGLSKSSSTAHVADADKRIRNLKRQMPSSVTADDCRSLLKDNNAQIQSTLAGLSKK